MTEPPTKASCTNHHGIMDNRYRKRLRNGIPLSSLWFDNNKWRLFNVFYYWQALHHILCSETSISNNKTGRFLYIKYTNAVFICRQYIWCSTLHAYWISISFDIQVIPHLIGYLLHSRWWWYIINSLFTWCYTIHYLATFLQFPTDIHIPSQQHSTKQVPRITLLFFKENSIAQYRFTIVIIIPSSPIFITLQYYRTAHNDCLKYGVQQEVVSVTLKQYSYLNSLSHHETHLTTRLNPLHWWRGPWPQQETEVNEKQFHLIMPLLGERS